MAIRLDAYKGPAGAGAFYAKCGFSERGRVSYRATRLIYYEMLLDVASGLSRKACEALCFLGRVFTRGSAGSKDPGTRQN